MNTAMLKTSGRSVPFNSLRMGAPFVYEGLWFVKVDATSGALMGLVNQVLRVFRGANVEPAGLLCGDDPRICVVEWVELRGSVATLERLPVADLPTWAVNLYAPPPPPKPVIQRAAPRRPSLFAELRARIACFLRPDPVPTMGAQSLSDLSWILAQAARDVRAGATVRGGAYFVPSEAGNHILVDVKVVK